MYRDRSHDPYLRAILQDFDNDAPRMEYAKWLDARGNPHGEFIRVQCLLDDLVEGDPRLPGLRDREQRLWQDHCLEWKGDLPAIGQDLEWGDFHRGFPVANILLSDCNCHWENVYSTCHYFEWITRSFAKFVKFCNPAYMSIEMSGQSSGYLDQVDLLEGLAKSTHLKYAILIDMHGTSIRDAAVIALIDALAGGTQIRHLNFDQAGDLTYAAGDAAAQRLAASPALARLKTGSTEN